MCAQSLLHYTTNLDVREKKEDCIMSVIPLVTALVTAVLRQICKDHESPL